MRAGDRLVRLVFACVAGLAATAAHAQDGAVQSHAIGRFTFENGASLDNAHVTYVTWGRLNAAGDNAVLLPSWYGGRALNYQFLVGPDRVPGATDLYFPVADAEYERRFLPKVTFVPIPSLWGHSAGGGGNPADAAFINREIAAFLGKRSAGR